MTTESPSFPKTLFWWMLNLALLVAVFAGMAWTKFLGKQAETLTPRTITVSGVGEAVVIPDIAHLSFSVVSEGIDPAALQEENATKMNRALEFVKGQGISDADVKTSGYQLTPKYDYNRFTGASNIVGYSLTQTVSVKIRDFRRVGPILGNLPGLGINRIESFAFAVDDPEVYLAPARAQAFSRAREKAEEMARANGVRLGRVLTFSDSSGGFVPRYLSLAEAGRGGAPDAASLPAIEPGSEELKVQVSVTYELR